MAYWDTSCVLKLYAAEPDSTDFKSHVAGGATLTTSEITRLEIFAALKRKESLKDLGPDSARVLFAGFDNHTKNGLIALVALDLLVISNVEQIIDACYAQLPPLMLRTLDAIHLASAVVSGEREMVTADRRLRDAAVMLGLSVFPRP